METPTLVKCGTTIGLAAGTVAATVGVVAAASIAAKVSFVALATLGLAATWGSVTAALDSKSVEEYVAKLPTHTSIALSTIFVSVSTSLFGAIINAAAQALGDAVYTALTGRKTTRISFA